MLDQQFSEITINGDLPWYMTPDGFLVQDGGAKAIGLSQPKSLNELEKVGNNMLPPDRQDRAGAAGRAECATRLPRALGLESRSIR